MDRVERVTRRLKLRQLETLMSVAQWGSMAKAAEHLAVAQPVVSRSIANLESVLGVRLLDRTFQGVEPTIYGRALLQRSIAMFNDLRTSVTELEFLSGATAGELRIGSSDAVAVGMLGVIMDRLSRQYPGLSFEVMLGIADLPHDELRARNIDLVIGRLPNTIPDDMDATVLYDEQSFIVAGAQNPLTRRRQVKLAELVKEPWCGPSFDSFPWSLVGDAFRERGLELPRIVVNTRSILARYGMVATGRFLTILPRTALHFSAKSLSLKRVAVDMPDLTYPVGIITLKNRTLNPVAHLFIDCCREVAKPFGSSVAAEKPGDALPPTGKPRL
jgi:DNA-binding transcriptional LysR family regulator